MIPRIATLPVKKLVGMQLTMSYSAYKAHKLWPRFMPRRKEIVKAIGSDLYSMQIFSPTFFDNFNPVTTFEYWAATAVSDFKMIPEGMESFTIPSGLCAIFSYKGDASGAPAVFEYILSTWLPNSDYFLDNRPHFEILEDKFKNNNTVSEEEIWIPLKLK